MSRPLRLVIEFPGLYTDDLPHEFEGAGDESEQVQDALQLASDTVVVVFAGYEGDAPGTVLRSLEGTIVEFGLAHKDTNHA